jgi:hypothetical protein
LNIPFENFVERAKSQAKDHPIIAGGIGCIFGPCVLTLVLAIVLYPFIYMTSSEAEWERLNATPETEKAARSEAGGVNGTATEIAKTVREKRKARKKRREKREREREQQEQERNFKARMAWSACQRGAEQKLKAPATAEFAPTYKVRGGPQGDGVWLVKGYVDAKNSFGTKLRLDVACKLRERKEDDSTFRVVRAEVSQR